MDVISSESCYPLSEFTISGCTGKKNIFDMSRVHSITVHNL
jgi:hypothetical protein